MERGLFFGVFPSVGAGCVFLVDLIKGFTESVLVAVNVSTIRCNDDVFGYDSGCIHCSFSLFIISMASSHCSFELPLNNSVPFSRVIL